MVMEAGDKVLEVQLSQQRHSGVIGCRSMYSKRKGGLDPSNHEDRRCRGEVGGIKGYIGHKWDKWLKSWRHRGPYVQIGG